MRLDTPGVSRPLADERARRLGDLRYALHLTIPRDRHQPIAGSVQLRFTLTDCAAPLLLDFEPAPPDAVHGALVNGVSVAPASARGHLSFAADTLRAGENTIVIRFEAGDASLNRRDDLLYTLFVPARAREAFPCFDQPNLKARWSLTLDLPTAWTAVSNSARLPASSTAVSGDDRHLVSFAETRPLPTYLFAFAAGILGVEYVEREGRPMRVFHAGVEPALLAANLATIADGHAEALAWMEDYTAVPYPFDTFDIVLVPAFQFGGMEHPGAIFYNATTLLLQPTATEQQQLARAHVIAHETAHMWFGDLVTMPWFDDVWMKEVFANFMAARIVNPRFSGIDHDLRFLQAHYPGAYDVDRTAGAHPIRQPLGNLNDAGSVYGAIIYLKSPVMMRQLELLVGEAALRDALRRYLTRYAYGTAAWPDLVALLADGAPVDIQAWARAWVDEAGRPVVWSDAEYADDTLVRFTLTMTEARGENAEPVIPVSSAAQRLDLAVGRHGRVEHVTCWLDGTVSIAALEGGPVPDFVLPNGRGLGYGEFHLDRPSRTWLLLHLPEVQDPLTRGSAWLTLWDAMLVGEVDADALLTLAGRALLRETHEPNLQRLLTCTERLFWIFTDARVDAARSLELEHTLRAALDAAPTTSAKAAIFATLRSVAVGTRTLAWLQALWSGDTQIPDLPLAEPDQIAIVQELALREPRFAPLLDQQLAQTKDRERRDALAFLAPALSHSTEERDRFFSRLADPDQRRREPWVIEGQRWLHHPLRERQSPVYLEPALRMLEDLKRTGDIFLPKRWVDAMLSGHRSSEAARIVQAFLESRPDTYPQPLRRQVLASADHLFRAARRRTA